MKSITKHEKEILIREFNTNGNKHKVKFEPRQGYITHDYCKVFATASINKKSNGKSHYCIDRFADLVTELLKEGVCQ